jgi:poly-gamma-glutamate capsule biosynthesis protein CapA/YwtB (metallophosphatase superfamily)
MPPRPCRPAAVAAAALLAVASASIGAAHPDRAPHRAESARIVLAGDVGLGRGVALVMATDPGAVFADVRHILTGADLALANLESPLAGPGKPGRRGIDVGAGPSSAVALAEAGLDAVGISNNHAGDGGRQTVPATLDALDRAGVSAVGGGRDAHAAWQPYLVRSHGVRIAVLAVDATTQGPAATGTRAGVAHYHPGRLRRAVADARRHADVVVVGVHGGIEMLDEPDPGQRRIATLLASWGADVVWGHGSHVAQPVIAMHSRRGGRTVVVATSLGNLVFDMGARTTNGALLELLVDRHGVVAHRVGSTDQGDLRVRFSGWTLPAGDAVALDRSWWALDRPVRAERVIPARAMAGRLADAEVLDAALGDADGDGRPELVASFLRAARPRPLHATAPRWAWTDSRGRSAHLGVYRLPDLEGVWVAGAVGRPVTRVAVCDGALAVRYGTLDGRTNVAGGAWWWRGFGFRPAVDLPGTGRPGCADVDRDGRSDVLFLERSSQ